MRPRPDANGQYIAGCAVQDAVCRRAEKQSKTLPTVAPYDDGVDIRGHRDAVNFCLRASENQVSVRVRHTGGLTEIVQARLGLLLDLILYRRHVHGNVAAIHETERFDHVNDMQLCAEKTRQLNRPLADDARLLGKVDSKQNTFVSAHAIALRPGCGDDTTQ